MAIILADAIEAQREAYSRAGQEGIAPPEHEGLLLQSGHLGVCTHRSTTQHS